MTGSRNQLPCELLAPAGSWESMVAAFRAGADAVYMGGPRFGARAYAENPDEDGLRAAIDLAHLHGKKLYLTVNTLLKEWELRDELGEYLEPLYRHGLDAVIVQDLGVLAFIRAHFPGLDIHASTQMTVASPWGARLTEQLGACRLVLPPGAFAPGGRGDPRDDGTGDRGLRPRGALLLLFGAVSAEQPDRRPQRQPGALCAALPPSV